MPAAQSLTCRFSPDLLRFALFVGRRFNYRPSVSVTSRRPIGVDESIVSGHPTGSGYHPEVSNSPVSPHFTELPGNFVAVRRFVHYPRSPRSPFYSRSPLTPHPFATPPHTVRIPVALYMFYPLTSFWRRRLIGTGLYIHVYISQSVLKCR